MSKDVIVACDFPTAKDTFEFLDAFTAEKPFVKIGMELFYAEGPAIVREIKKRGHKIFLDLKLHDIPTTVNRAMQVLADLQVDMTNVHAAGGIKMMSEGLKGLQSRGNAPILIAVTQLTSTSEEVMRNEILIEKDLPEVVTAYAKNAKTAGLRGVVCSPLEAGIIHRACGPDFLTITPGIRFETAAADDQTRITTPAKAKVLGSDYIVVGRPITRSDDPVAAYRRCVSDFLG